MAHYIIFPVKCPHENYKLLHTHYYPTNHTQAGITSAQPCRMPKFTHHHYTPSRIEGKFHALMDLTFW